MGNGNLFFKFKMNIEKLADMKLGKAKMFVCKHESGKKTKCQSSCRGNRTYAWLTQKRLDNAVREMHRKGGTLLMLTLTAHYDPQNLDDIFDSWRRMKYAWPTFLQWLRRHGFSSFYYALEAHELGGCHIHCVIRYDKKLESKIDKKDNTVYKVFRLADKNFEQEIKNAWKRQFIVKTDVDIKFADAPGASAYVSKDAGGENSHIEDALERSKRNWSIEGDKEFQSRDIKKLWGFYNSSKAKPRLRRWGFSNDLKIERYEEEKSIDPIVDYILIPHSIQKTFFINNIGNIDENTIEGQFINAEFERSNRNHRIPMTIGAMTMEAAK
jgi:hypothetical protein